MRISDWSSDVCSSDLHQITRRVSRQIRVGRVAIGGDAPISVQTMTNTDTEDVAATVAQIRAAMKAGDDIVRVSVPTLAAAQAFGEIKKEVGYVPLVADIHFNYKCALAAAEADRECTRLYSSHECASRVRSS